MYYYHVDWLLALLNVSVTNGCYKRVFVTVVFSTFWGKVGSLNLVQATHEPPGEMHPMHYNLSWV